jgi:hypothetical protein
MARRNFLTNRVTCCAMAALVAAGCRPDDEGLPPEPPPTVRRRPPPEPSVCTAFDRMDRPLPPRPAPSGCDWVPGQVEPRRFTIRTTNPKCYTASTTGDGKFFTYVTWLEGKGDQWAFIGRGGEVLSSFWHDDPVQSFAPLETKVTGIFNPKIPDPIPPHPVRRIPVMVSLDMDGQHGSTIVEYNAVPPWDGIGVDSVIPYPAVGKAFGAAEWTGFQGGFEWHVYVWIFDENASVCGVPWEAASGKGIDGGPPPTPWIAVDENMNVLILFDFSMFYGFPGRQSARWYTVDGKPLTDEFEAPIGHAVCSHVCFPGQHALVPLIGGGLVYQEGQQWLAYFPSAEPRVEPAPTWLTDWNFHTLHQVGGRGYAVIPYTGGGSEYPRCEDRINFVSAHGDPCGTMMLDVWPCDSGGVIFVGRDGSVIQRGPTSTYEHPDDCEFVIWDRLLE